MGNGKTEPVRNSLVICGAIRERAEHLKANMLEGSRSVDRLIELTDELERSLLIEQFENSVRFVEGK